MLFSIGCVYVPLEKKTSAFRAVFICSVVLKSIECKIIERSTRASSDDAHKPRTIIVSETGPVMGCRPWGDHQPVKLITNVVDQSRGRTSTSKRVPPSSIEQSDS